MRTVIVEDKVQGSDGTHVYKYKFQVIGDLNKPGALRLIQGPGRHGQAPWKVYQKAVRVAIVTQEPIAA